MDKSAFAFHFRSLATDIQAPQRAQRFSLGPAMKWVPFGSDWVADLVMFGCLRM